MGEGDVEVRVDADVARPNAERAVHAYEVDEEVAFEHARVELLNEGGVKALEPSVPARMRERVLAVTDG